MFAPISGARAHPLIELSLLSRFLHARHRSQPGSTYATRLSAGGVADEWVVQLLRQGDAKVFKK